MTPERWRRVEQILRAAIALDPAARTAHVEQAAGDDRELRHEVLSLPAVR